jgi:predicted alpha/beta-hydrolase family hydrolase
VSNLEAREELVPTPAGIARLDWFPASGQPRAVALLGHGTATGVEAADLQALAAVLPWHGITVALVTQPYRVEGNPRVSDEASLDSAWKAVWPGAAGLGLPVISGGRSAGSQVACRTAAGLGALAVLALAYPLLGPGSPRELLATGRSTLIIQGGSDPFGRPG